MHAVGAMVRELVVGANAAGTTWNATACAGGMATAREDGWANLAPG